MWTVWLSNRECCRPYSERVRSYVEGVPYQAVSNESFYEPALSSIRYGQGLIIVEGWLFQRVFLYASVGFLLSVVAAVGWSAVRNVGEGFTIGSYVLGADVVFISLLSLTSVCG